MSSSTEALLHSLAGSTWLTAAQMMAYLDLSRTTFYRLIRDDPSFPRPRYIRPRVPRWNREAVDAWLEAQLSEEAERELAEAEA